MTVPAMAAIEILFEVETEVELDCGCELVVEGADWEDPCDDCVEVGDEPVKQLLSSEQPTVLTSELPP